MTSAPTKADDKRYMQMALRLATRGLGQTWPNPSVGCVLVKDGQVIASARTAASGRPHAETAALEQAGGKAKGATAYVTLEPCSHHGTTPPCADALIKAGIARVVIACTDPDTRVNGKGVALLAKADIEVITGICEYEAIRQHEGFFSRIHHDRPHIALKIATSADGMIATSSGESQWITGEDARDHAHLLRARYDAVLTGIGTVETDNPALTCRLPGLENASPVRIVLDSQLRISPGSQLVQDAANIPLWLLTTEKAPQAAIAALETKRVKIAILPANPQGHVDIAAAVTWITRQGITRLLVEGGAKINAAFIHAGLLDRVYWYRAPLVIGKGGLPAISSLHSGNLAELPRFTCEESLCLGKDMLDIYSRK